MESYVCPICGNKDQRFIGNIHGKLYCRKCVTFKGELAKPKTSHIGTVSLNLHYSLTKEQKEISDKLIENYKKHVDSLVNAVCGAGKTELIYGVIAYALINGHQVGFALPRRDVAIELIARFKDAFPSNKVTLVIGGETNRLIGDIIILTTHQLFRYPSYFDLLIVDEIDAFPYKGNDVLNALFRKAVRGNHILMSATPDEKTLREYSKPGHDVLELNVRFHHSPLPIPKIELAMGMFKFVKVVKYLEKFINEKKPVFIFTPTIGICNELYLKLSRYFRNGNYVHSKRENRERIIKDFKDGHYSFLVTTAVLERGVTIKNLQVIIYEADNSIYDEHSLVQIAGRVGRKYDAREGEVIFIGSYKTNAMERAIQTIRRKNEYLQDV